MALFRIDRVRMRHFRGFECLDLRLSAGVTVLYGDNGAGKSNAISALARLLGGLLQPAFGSLRATDAWEPEVPADASRQGRLPVELDAWGEASGAPMSWGRALHSLDGRVTNAELKPLRAWFTGLQSQRAAWPLIARFGPQRHHEVVYDTKRRRPSQAQRMDGYLDCLDTRSNVVQLLQWWYNVHYARLAQQPSRAYDVLERVMRIAAVAPTDAAAPDRVREIQISAESGLPIFRMESGRSIRWEHLSDGYRAFLGVIGDLTRRAWLLNGGVLDDPVEQAEGVVLIDEVDLHLHPRWQARVVPVLRSTFPGVQFVVTTHSPYVLAGVANDEVRELGDGRLLADTAYVQHRDPRTVLTHVQGAPARSPWASERLDRIAALLHARRHDEARRWVEELAIAWGEDDPEVLRLRARVGAA
ncbi:MAG TPA: AAA family ATPase [Myxococcota bacterium]|nr:AAA family ATPase [Myxococcota bacterium]